MYYTIRKCGKTCFYLEYYFLDFGYSPPLLLPCKFIEHMNIGDIVVIPFAGVKKCIVARIVSEPLYGIDTKLFTSIRNEGKEIQIKSEGNTPFRPVGRKIQILLKDAQFKDKRKSLSRSSFQPIDSNILNQIL